MESLVFGLLLLLVSTGCGRRTDQRVVTLAAAASTAEVVTALTNRWAREHPGVTVRVTVAASSVLARQIVAGAPVDLFLSADDAQSAVVADAGLAASTRSLVGNRMVLVGRDGSAGEADLPGLLVRGRCVVADAAVPAGRSARAWLTAVGWPEHADTGCVSVGSVRNVLAAIRAGNGTVGFVYGSDAKVAPDEVHVLATARSDQSGPIRYPLVVTRRAGADARELADFLASPQALEVFEGHGFLSLEASD